jgi:hypothetical protein
MQSDNKIKYIISDQRYALIPPLPEEGKFFMHFPGVYCKNCGKDFALYNYGAKPDGIDWNKKPFYSKCPLCPEDESQTS